MKFSASTVQTSHDSPLGRIILASSDNKLVGVWFDGQRHQPATSTWPDAPNHPVLQQARAQLTDYFAERRTAFELPLDLDAGTAFQQEVWRALLKIPCGATRNPLSIIVPCHRVLGAGGALTGYAGGLERKTALLQLEGQP
jgi:methylated-DNA-[protein]-cysteine S-methyltransferase